MAATVGFFQITSPKRSRRGKQRSWELRNCKTLLADLTRRNVVKMRSRRSRISPIGIFANLADGVAHQTDGKRQR